MGIVMIGIRSEGIGARATVCAISLVNLLTFSLAACSADPEDLAVREGRGPLVAPAGEITSCERAVYRGPDTLLYSNRPYHTADLVETAAGLSFCRGARHGTNVWTVEVSRPTTFVVFASASFGLERRGWTASGDGVFVAAAGVPFDRVYTKRFAPGRYVIRQGFTPSAPIVLWDAAAVRPVP